MFLGRFEEGDRIICFYKDGSYELTDFELTNRYETDAIVLIEKFHPDKVISAIYFDVKSGNFYAKRFLIEAQTLKNKYVFIKEGEGNYLELVTTKQEPVVVLKTGKKKTELTEEEVTLYEKIEVTGWKTVGTRIAGNDLKEVSLATENEEETEGKEAPTLF
jgi:topoisomerase-4 subunit A